LEDRKDPETHPQTAKNAIFDEFGACWLYTLDETVKPYSTPETKFYSSILNVDFSEIFSARCPREVQFKFVVLGALC
jgi:hypothetical protein